METQSLETQSFYVFFFIYVQFIEDFVDFTTKKWQVIDQEQLKRIDYI